MAEHILPGAPPIPLVLRRSGRARRISLRISQLDGRVTLTLPNGVPDAEALEFAASKGAWIRNNLTARPDDVQIAPGAIVSIEGVPCRISLGTGRRVVTQPGEVFLPKGPAGPRLAAWLRVLARDRLAEASDRYAAELGQTYSRITLRDTRSRWGSCSSQKALMYSWRLILAPPEVLQYVAAHEVAHLVEMNHSSAFWDTVEQVFGAYSAPRQWLRQNGATLHRYRF